MTYPSSVTATNKYNPGGDLTSLTDVLGTTTLASYSYVPNAASKVTSETDNGGSAVAYSYSKSYELATAGTTSFAPDLAGDVGVVPSGDTLNYDGGSRITAESAGGTPYSFSYNADGARTSGVANVADQVTPLSASYTYDSAGELDQTTIGGTTESYGYSGDGLLAYAFGGNQPPPDCVAPTTCVIPQGAAVFSYDEASGANPLVIADGSNYYLYGPGDTPIEQINENGTAIPTYLQTDGNGSVRLSTNATGQVTFTQNYDPYGAETGSNATSGLGWQGQYYLAGSDLYYMRARDYDPGTGQFLTIDPQVTATMSPYSYAGDDPVNGSDPSGQNWLSDIGRFLTSKGFLHAVSTVLSIAAATLVFVSGVGIVGLAAIGMVAFLADAADALINHTGWSAVVLDGLALIPALGELRYLRNAKVLMEEADAVVTTGRAIRPGAIAAKAGLMSQARWYVSAAGRLDLAGKIGTFALGANPVYHVTEDYVLPALFR